MNYRRAALLALFSASLLGGACSRVVRLQPSGRTETDAEGSRVAVAEGKNIRLIVDPRRWEGQEGVLAEITPVRVRIENRNRQPLRITYASFTIANEGGERFQPLSPYGLKGSVEETKPKPQADITVSWEEKLPTAEILARAIQEGKLEGGSWLEGYLYFPPISPDETKVDLTARFQNFYDGADVVTLSAPFTVVSEQ